MVEAAREAGVERLVYFQTALCYGTEPLEHPITLEHPIRPDSSYAISKTAGEQYIELSGIPFVSLRLANIYGPRNVSGPPPTFWQRLTEGKPCFAMDTRRDFIYVSDLIEVVTAALGGTGQGHYHVSTGSDYSIKEMFDAVVEAMGVELEEEVEVRPAPARGRSLDPARPHPDAEGLRLGGPGPAPGGDRGGHRVVRAERRRRDLHPPEGRGGQGLRLGRELGPAAGPCGEVAVIRKHFAVLLGGGLLAAALILNVATLTGAPPLFGDEAWFASTAWSAASGHGLEPALASDAGIYDSVPDYWASRVASTPQVVAELVFPTSLTLHRGAVLLVALGALGIFGLAMRRLHDTGIALLSCAALAMTFGFFAASHWVRWDAAALLFASAILLAFVSGPPRPLLAAGAGALIGVAPDFAFAICGLFPGALILCAWEREQRGARVGAFAGGVVLGMALFGLFHFGGGGLSEARDQYEAVYEPIYGEIPLLAALGDLSLGPLLDESDRYALMGFEPFVANFVVVAVGALAAVLVLARQLGAPVRGLWPAGLTGSVLIAGALIGTAAPYELLRWFLGLMIVGGFGAMIALGVRALRRPTEYPTQAAPAILFASMLAGYGLLLGYKGGTYVVFSFPFAVGSVVAAMRVLAPEPPLRDIVPVAGLVAATLASAVFLVDQIRSVPEEPALDAELSAEAREIVPEGETVMGEWVYWWLYEDERFRFNSALWQQRWLHPSDTFADSFARVCPDNVLLDDRWLARYASAGVSLYANQAPTDPREKAKLRRLLEKEYRLERTIEADGRTLRFWERRAPDCGGRFG